MKNVLITWGVGIVLIVLLILGVQRCNNRSYVAPKGDTTTKITKGYGPTIAVNKQAAPKLVSSTSVPIPEYRKPSKNYDSLARQYDSLLMVLYARNEYVDSQQIDSSVIKTYSSVQENKLVGQRYEWKLRIPTTTITNTIKIPEEPRRQLYFNYGLDGGYRMDVPNNQWSVGVLGGFSYKDRQDRMYTANGSFNTDNQWRVQFIKSGKISFRRKK